MTLEPPVRGFRAFADLRAGGVDDIDTLAPPTHAASSEWASEQTRPR